MNIRYKCPWTGKQILEVPIEVIKTLGGETPCPYCNEAHPLPICLREYVKKPFPRDEDWEEGITN